MAVDRFTKMQKVAIFLIVLREERTREILTDVDLNTVEQVNAAISSLDTVTAEEKAGVMLEFAHFFYEDKPITASGHSTWSRLRHHCLPLPHLHRQRRNRPIWAHCDRSRSQVPMLRKRNGRFCTRSNTCGDASILGRSTGAGQVMTSARVSRDRRLIGVDKQDYCNS